MIPSYLSLTYTPTFSGDPALPSSTSAGLKDDVQEDSDHDENMKTILECVFIAAAVFTLVFALLIRLVCLRRAGRRPFRDFLKSVPSVEHTPSPLPSPTTTRTNYARHTIALPLSPHSSTAQMTYAQSSVPVLPIAAHTTDESGIEAMAQHLAGRSRRPLADRMDTLPLYDNKGVPPRYQDIARSPTPSDVSSSGHQPARNP
ncbi:hypothetical protein PHLGIDRAFT_35723 [Phlebiopsis gigantea 11061_1 CR5-6]|uniref:Uncharacterized protein n=1 Tax=Phlebiopsis gigantea (strain 11061_1 CR5-6) TaxID=745531 RepID=A0A0C3NP50_PHLG1|nr:hypothetical protein PHLGIDRAFT_35723 [Phlebiopsis gigantea 11061_1 CR5-6]